MNDLISRQDAIDALWKALYEYEDKTEKQFQKSDDLDVGDWIVHRIFVQNMNDIDRQAILNLPSVTSTTHLIKYWAERKHGHGVEHIPHCKCANCGVEYPPRIAQNIKYCAYCGARFEERDK